MSDGNLIIVTASDCPACVNLKTNWDAKWQPMLSKYSGKIQTTRLDLPNRPITPEKIHSSIAQFKDDLMRLVIHYPAFVFIKGDKKYAYAVLTDPKGGLYTDQTAAMDPATVERWLEDKLRVTEEKKTSVTTVTGPTVVTAVTGASTARRFIANTPISAGMCTSTFRTRPR